MKENTRESLNDIFAYVPFVRLFYKRRQVPGVRPKNRLLATGIDLLSLFVLYVLLSPAVAMPLYNSLLFHPSREDTDLSQQTKQIADFFHCTFTEVTFKAPDGESLHGWYFNHPGSRNTIILSHGNAGNLEGRLVLCPILLQSGSSVFLYDYEGFGKSTGHPTVLKVCDDAVSAFDYVVDQLHVEPAHVVLYGESIGTGITSELSTRRKPGAIILQSPFTSLPDVAADHLFFLKLYPHWVYPEPRLSNIDIMSRPHAPLLIIHGKKDSLLSYHYSERIMNSAVDRKTLLLLPHAGHADIFVTDVASTVPALNRFLSSLP